MATMRNRLLPLIHKCFLSITSSSRRRLPCSTYAFFSSSSLSSSFTAQFLVNSCGLPLHSALSVSKKIRIEENDLHKPKSVIQFLKSHHFTDTHIASLIEKRPKVLRYRVEDNLKPKFDFFIANGFAGKHLHDFIVTTPHILARALDSCIKPYFEFLTSYLHTKDKVMVALKRIPWTSMNVVNIKPNVDILIKEGMPVDRFARLIVSYPRTVLHKHDRLVSAVNFLKNLGLGAEDNVFVDALGVTIWMSDSDWKKKTEVMKSLGWSEKEIISIFKRHPKVLGYSEKKLRSGIDFLMNTLDIERKIIINYPYLLGFSIEKRIRPRYNVIKCLESEELLTKGDRKIAIMLIISEKNFLENFVTKYVDKVPGLLEIYSRKGQSDSQLMPKK